MIPSLPRMIIQAYVRMITLVSHGNRTQSRRSPLRRDRTRLSQYARGYPRSRV